MHVQMNGLYCFLPVEEIPQAREHVGCPFSTWNDILASSPHFPPREFDRDRQGSSQIGEILTFSHIQSFYTKQALESSGFSRLLNEQHVRALTVSLDDESKYFDVMFERR